MNRKVGLGVLTPPPGMLDATESLGAVRTPRPTPLERFNGSRRAKYFRRNLTLILSPGGGEETHSRFMAPMCVHSLEVQASHGPRAKAAASSAHSKHCRALLEVPELREAFGVRPACWRFGFMVPMRDSEIVETAHEPVLGARHLCRFTVSLPRSVEAA